MLERNNRDFEPPMPPDFERIDPDLDCEFGDFDRGPLPRGAGVIYAVVFSFVLAIALALILSGAVF